MLPDNSGQNLSLDRIPGQELKFCQTGDGGGAGGIVAAASFTSSANCLEVNIQGSNGLAPRTTTSSTMPDSIDAEDTEILVYTGLWAIALLAGP